MSDELEAPAPALPVLVRVSESFSSRLPSQRVMDELAKVEPFTNFGDLAAHQPFRIVAFRALLRDFPDRDVTSLWMHSYDVEVEVEAENPTNGNGPMLSPPSAPTGIVSPTT